MVEIGNLVIAKDILIDLGKNNVVSFTMKRHLTKQSKISISVSNSKANIYFF